MRYLRTTGPLAMTDHRLASTACFVLAFGLLSPAAAPVLAQPVSYQGWGVRAGVGDDPDQVLVGLHWHLGDVVPRLRLQPSVELGAGDDHTVLSATLPVHYHFPVDGSLSPYAGGGLLVSFIDRDRPRRGQDSSEIDISPLAVGGVEWRLAGGTTMFVELNLARGDAHDARLWVGWTF